MKHSDCFKGRDDCHPVLYNINFGNSGIAITSVRSTTFKFSTTMSGKGIKHLRIDVYGKDETQIDEAMSLYRGLISKERPEVSGRILHITKDLEDILVENPYI